MNSELRQDLVSGDWIIIAPKRAKRPEQFIKKAKRKKTPLKGCPFEDPQKSGHDNPILIYTRNQFQEVQLPLSQKSKVKSQKSNEWLVQVIQNKFPVFTAGPGSETGVSICVSAFQKGPYWVVDGKGHHDLVITRDHHKNFPHLSIKQAELTFKAFQDRYKMFFSDNCLAYALIFHNWGPKAGASIYHPHYQIIALPVIPPDVQHSLNGSLNYFEKNEKCVHCVMIDWERRNKSRVIYENKKAIAFAPFVSREPFEIRIFPKIHSSFFEDASPEELSDIVEALQNVLLRIEKKLKDPDYNFFIHTAPLRDKQKYSHYHWHIEILPKISTSAGFELGTGIEITVVDPDEAAKILKF